MLWVKICGMTSAEDALVAADAGADAIGMIFAPSKRRVTVEQAREIVQSLPRTMEKVGVFYDEEPRTIEDIAEQVGLTAVQLHGDESPEMTRGLFKDGSKLNRSRMRVFKTLHVNDGLETVAKYFLNEHSVDGFLLDTVAVDPATGQVERGGTGQTFDWRKMTSSVIALQRQTRIVVAGGLSASNVDSAVRILQPWGVDVCTGVELEPGKKNHQKVREFVTAARDAHN